MYSTGMGMRRFSARRAGRSTARAGRDACTIAGMNYKHIYHAGNFADVAKHVALVYCLGALQRKDAGFFALDTHAGRGSYDLHSPEAKKSKEAEQGIQRLLEALPD